MRLKNKNFSLLSLLPIAFILVLAVLLTNCGKEDGEHAHAEGDNQHKNETAADHTHEAGEADHDHESETEADAHEHLHIKPEIIKQWGIQYTSPAPRDYVEKITLTGVIKENKETTFIVNSLVDGIVAGIKKDIGDTVKKGDILCLLNSRELLARKTEYIKAFQNYRLTMENYRRAQDLSRIKAIENKELISRETAYKTAMAEYFSLEAELGTIGFDAPTLHSVKEAVEKDEAAKLKDFLSPLYPIPSPASGKVTGRTLTLGARVENNTPIFEISDTRKLWVMMDAMEKDLQYIEREKPVMVVSDIYPGKLFSGRVLILMEKIDPELRTVKVRAEVDNPDGLLKPEMYVRGRLEKKVRAKNLAVPSLSLVKISGVDGVFIIETDGFLFKPVQVMEVDSDAFAFVQGLKEDDLVVTDGSFYLKAEYEIQRGGGTDAHAGHSH